MFSCKNSGLVLHQTFWLESRFGGLFSSQPSGVRLERSLLLREP